MSPKIIRTLRLILGALVLFVGAGAFYLARPTAHAQIPRPRPRPPVAVKIIFGASFNPVFYALRPQDGGLLWSTPMLTYDSTTPSKVDIFDTLIFTGNAGYVVALNYAEGNIVWKYMMNNITTAPPTYSEADNAVYVASWDYSVYALNAPNGTLKWKFPTHFTIYGAPLVVNHVVYVASSDGYLYALNAANGALLWKTAIGTGAGHSTPTIANGIIYIGTIDGYVYAIQATTGQVMWRLLVEHAGAPEMHVPMILGNQLYISSNSLTLYDIDITKQQVAWQQTIGACDNDPAVDSVNVLVGCEDGILHSYSPTTGAPQWTFHSTPDGSPYTIFTPVIESGVVYFASYDRHLYAVNEQTHALLWRVYGPGGTFYDFPSIGP